MKNILLLILIFTCSFELASAGTLVLEGKYQNQNLYVINGTMDNGVGFCTYQVSINGEISTDEVNSSSFEIDFTQFNIKPGTPVVVRIEHKDDCSPKVINPEVLQPRATFEVVNINLDRNGILNWSTKNEMGSLPFIIEQYRWHKWVEVGEVTGKGNMDKNSYSFKVLMHSGENKFRVKQVGYGDISKKSSSITITSSVSEPSYMLSKDTKSIMFSSETLYEVYDAYGKVLKRGYGKNLNVSNLEKGNYYLCYDNIITEFKKKGNPFFQ